MNYINKGDPGIGFFQFGNDVRIQDVLYRIVRVCSDRETEGPFPSNNVYYAPGVHEPKEKIVIQQADCSSPTLISEKIGWQTFVELRDGFNYQKVLRQLKEGTPIEDIDNICRSYDQNKLSRIEEILRNGSLGI